MAPQGKGKGVGSVNPPRRIAFTPKRLRKLHQVCSYSTSSTSPKTARHWLNCKSPPHSAKLFLPYRWSRSTTAEISCGYRWEHEHRYCSQLFWERSLSSSACKRHLFPMFTSISIDSSGDYLTPSCYIISYDRIIYRYVHIYRVNNCNQFAACCAIKNSSNSLHL